MRYLHTRLVTPKEFWSAIHELGAVYFARDDRTDMIKIGHSRDPWKRLSDLQVGNSNRLDLIGVIAASKEIEKLVHGNFPDGHARGEWFYDRGVISQWLMGMTQSEPMYRHIWRLVPGREFFCEWHEETRSHTKHYWDPDRQVWDPPLTKVSASAVS
jgi:Meiotically up-regulated gene 113